MENRRLNKNTVVEENESELVVDKNGIARSMGLIQYMAVSNFLIFKYIFIKWFLTLKSISCNKN